MRTGSGYVTPGRRQGPRAVGSSPAPTGCRRRGCCLLSTRAPPPAAAHVVRRGRGAGSAADLVVPAAARASHRGSRAGPFPATADGCVCWRPTTRTYRVEGHCRSPARRHFLPEASRLAQPAGPTDRPDRQCSPVVIGSDEGAVLLEDGAPADDG